MSSKLKRSVTCSCEFEPAGLIALHDRVAADAYSPPGAFGAGEVSMLVGGLGSVTYSHAVLPGGVAVESGPLGHGWTTGTPSMCVLTTFSTSALVGRALDALTAALAPSRAAWLSVS